MSALGADGRGFKSLLPDHNQGKFMRLIDLADPKLYDTDKKDLGYIDAFYDTICTDRRYTAKNILEIGIFKGGSALLWRDYFHNAVVHGVDMIHCSAISNQPRIVQSVDNAYDFPFISSLNDDYYDIIIDDGPHTFPSMVIFLTQYLRKLKKGGVMILEDIVDINWTPHLLALVEKADSVKNASVINMANCQLDPVLNDRWRNGLDVIIVEK